MSDDEWEYEYSPTQTSTFYLPLDLSNLPREQKNTDTARRTGHPTLLKSRLRALNAQRSIVDAAPGTNTATTNDDDDGGGEEKILGRVQVINLHTANPLVVYNGQVLSVQWASTIGTDLFFARPRDAGETDTAAETDTDREVETETHGVQGEPLRKLPHVDLLGTSSAKLIARLGRLRPRDEALEALEGAAEQGRSEDVQNTSSPSSFLARLNAVKERRGEARLVLDRGVVAVGAAAGPSPAVVHEGVDVEMGGT